MSVFYFTAPRRVSNTNNLLSSNTNNTSNTTRIYELSCTTNISIRSPAKVTSSPVEDGSSIVDNYYLDNKVGTFTGIITNIRLFSGIIPEIKNLFGIGAGNTLDQGTVLEPDQWIRAITNLRNEKVLLTLHADTESIPNCLITEFDLDKTKDEGLSGWKCNMTFQEVDISERARIVEIPEPKQEVKDEVAPKSNVSSSSSKDAEEELTRTISNFGTFTGGGG